MQHIQITAELSTMYPDIKEQLCNKHTTKYTQIKHQFQRIYSDNKPTWYVSAAGIAYMNNNQNHSCIQTMEQMDEQRSRSWAMAVQSGVVIAVSPTTSKANVYVNYNKWQEQAQLYQLEFEEQADNNFEQELILNYKGEVQKSVNISNKTKQISLILARIYEMAIQDVSLNKIKGAILYINSTLYEDNLFQRQALLYAYFYAILMVNGLHKEYTIQEVNHKLSRFFKNEIKDQQQCQQLQRYQSIFTFENRNLMAGRIAVELPAINRNKFLFVKVPLGQSFKKNKNQQASILGQIVQYQQEQGTSITSISQVQKVLQEIKNKYMSISSSQSTATNPFYQIIQNSIKYADGMFVTQNQQFLVLYVHQTYCAQLIRKLARQIKQKVYTVSSSTIENDTRDLLQIRKSKSKGINFSKWNTSKINIGEYVFSTLPSCGFSILDPKQQIWFTEKSS